MVAERGKLADVQSCIDRRKERGLEGGQRRRRRRRNDKMETELGWGTMSDPHRRGANNRRDKVTRDNVGSIIAGR